MRPTTLGLLAALALVASGCGSLPPGVNHDRLTKEHMEFINAVPRAEKPRVITIDDGTVRIPMSRRAWYATPPLLRFYLRGLGRVDTRDEYYFVRALSFLCIFLDCTATVFDKDGLPRHRESRLWLSCFLLQHRTTTLNLDTDKPEHHWSVRMINIPFTQLTMLGFGSDYLQLFFIPLVTPD